MAAATLIALSVLGAPSARPDADIVVSALGDSSLSRSGLPVDSFTPDTPLQSGTVPAIIATDTLPGDSLLVVPTVPVVQKEPGKSRIRYVKTDLDAPVVFSSSDSMVIMRRDSAFMYGSGSVTYGDIKLDAAQIEMDLNDNLLMFLVRCGKPTKDNICRQFRKVWDRSPRKSFHR